MTIQSVNLGTPPDGVDGDSARTAFEKINQNFGAPQNAASREVISDVRDSTPGKVLLIGFAGLGLNYEQFGNLPVIQSLSAISQGGLYRYAQDTLDRPPFGSGYGAVYHISVIQSQGQNYGVQLAFDYADNVFAIRRLTGAWGSWYLVYTGGNTTIDSNGFIKAASPIIKLFMDKIELNGDFSAHFQRVNLGHYLISGTAGLADEGWYIETPKDANGNIKVFVEYEQLPDNTLSIKTYEPDYSTGPAMAGEPVDIPQGRWIDIRLKSEIGIPEISQ